MADHAWVLENLAAYLADGLEPAERQQLEAHTADCADCAAALAQARRIDASLDQLFLPVRPGPDLEDRVIQSLRSQRLSRSLPIPLWPLAATAALVLLGLAGAIVSQLLGTEAPLRSLTQIALHTPAAQPLSRSWREQVMARLGDTRVPARSSVASDREEDLANTDLGVNDNSDSPSVKHIEDLSGPAPAAPPAPDEAGAETKQPPGSSPMSPGDDKSKESAPAASIPGPAGTSSYGLGRGVGGMGMMGGQPGLGGMGMMGGAGVPPADGTIRHNPGEDFRSLQGDAGKEDFKPGKLFEAEQKLAENTKKVPELAERLAQDDQKERPKDSKGRAQEPKPGKPGATEATDRPDNAPAPRKIIIRSGEVEFEVQSFDSAVATITLLVGKLQGFVGTVNSEKLANGKVGGSVVVRVPPEHLDELILQLRKELGKNGELKSQRIGSSDITKQYTDLESRLRAARAMEERLLQIIKTGKGEIKDLLAAEKELGVWRTRIEEIEGELRYYRNLVSLSTLTVSLVEKEISSPYALVETENVQMGIEVEEVDESLRAALKAVREARGRITRSELKQHAKGQFSGLLHFEVDPDASGTVRDRLKQLGTVARLDISRSEEAEGGTGKPHGSKVKRNDSRYIVSFYNLTTVSPRETVQVTVACIDPEAVYKKLLASAEKTAVRVVSTSLASPRPDQAQGTIQVEIRTPEADAFLTQIKDAGEVTQLQVVENPDVQNTTRTKRGFAIQLLALAAVSARETETIKLATKDVAGGYRALQEAVQKAKGRIINAQLNEQNPQNVSATLDFEVRRAEQATLSAALAGVGDIYTRTVGRAADGPSVVDSKVHWQLTLINQASIPARETHVVGLEVSNVEEKAAAISALVADRQGRTVDSQLRHDPDGQVTGRLTYDVPLARAPELIDRLKAFGTVRDQQTSKRADVPDSPLAVARIDLTLSNRNLLVSAGDGFWSKIRRGLSASLQGLAWSLMFVIIGVCFVLPWALLLYGVYRLTLRLRRPTPPAAA